MFLNRVIIFIIFIFSLLFFTCSGSDNKNDEKSIIIGKIFVVGNEPFTKLGLQVDKEKMYILDCTKELEEKLLQRQGMIVKVHFVKMEKTPEGFLIKVLNAEGISGDVK
jgi:hypothetical protein